MRENLEKSLVYMFGHEGGYVNDPNDPGGPTKYGITWKTLRASRGLPSKKEFDNSDVQMVKNLTLSEAEEIYRKNYWTQAGGDLLPAGIDFMTFDFGVNSGPQTAVKNLQRLVKVERVDGVVGVHTLQAVNNYPGGLSALINDYAESRLQYLRGLSNWKRYGKGWTTRVNRVKTQALGLLTGKEQPAPVITEPVPKAPEPKPNKIVTPENAAIAATITAGLGGMVSGSVVLQAALAALMVIAGLLGAYYLFKRIRSST